MKYNIKSEVFNFTVLALTILAGIYFYMNFPDRVASHWNFSGVVDGYSGKFVGAFGMPLLMLGMYFLFLAVPFLDPQKDRYEEFSKAYNVFRSCLLASLLVIFLSMGIYNLGYGIAVNRVVPWTVGILFVILGNYMGKIKPNWFFGIRTPWTLSDENVWTKTHRFGGYVFIFLGVLVVLSAYAGSASGVFLFAGGVAVSVLAMFIYSYVEYKKQLRKHV